MSETQLNRNASQTELNCRKEAVSARTEGQKEREREEREREKGVYKRGVESEREGKALDRPSVIER